MKQEALFGLQKEKHKALFCLQKERPSKYTMLILWGWGFDSVNVQLLCYVLLSFVLIVCYCLFPTHFIVLVCLKARIALS